MRPTARSQSALFHPLNHVLGTEGGVRALRVVMLSDIPISVSELARRTALQSSGVARLCARLEDLGVLEAVGRGSHAKQYRRAARFELADPLRSLFQAERERGETLLRELRQIVGAPGSTLRAGWLEGPVALGTDTPDDPIVVGVLVDPAAVEDTRLVLRRGLLHIQKKHDVVIELNVVTMAELKTLDRAAREALENVRPLAGPAPLDLLEASRAPRSAGIKGPRSHRELDARAADVGREVAERIRRDPSLIEEALRHVERRVATASAGEKLELEEWQDVLTTMSPPRLRRFLVQDSPRARRLRQSSPFSAVLGAEVRPQGGQGSRDRP